MSSFVGMRARPYALALVVGLLMPACARGPAVSTVTIGANLPLTGSDAEVGLAMARGYRRAVEAVNAAGGLRLGRPGRAVRVRLEVRDDGSDPAAVDGIIETLAREGCHALLGTASDVRTAMEAAVAERLGVPLVVNSVDAPGLPGARHSWVFSVAVAGDVEARAHATALALLRAIAAARTVDPVALRNALKGVRS